MISLTSFNNLNKDKTVDEICLIYAQALRTTSLAHNEFPVLSQCLMNEKTRYDATDYDDPVDNDSTEKKKD